MVELELASTFVDSVCVCVCETLGLFCAVTALLHSLHYKIANMKRDAEKDAALTHFQVFWPSSVCGNSCWVLHTREAPQPAP